jgi:hypothetical protein
VEASIGESHCWPAGWAARWTCKNGAVRHGYVGPARWQGCGNRGLDAAGILEWFIAYHCPPTATGQFDMLESGATGIDHCEDHCERRRDDRKLHGRDPASVSGSRRSRPVFGAAWASFQHLEDVDL